MSERALSAIVLAAGQGTRMRSARPKPLHMLCGRPLLRYVLDALDECDVDRAVVVVGYAADLVTKKMQENPGPVPLDFVEQRVQAGTGDAVAVGLTGIPEDDLDALDQDDGDVLVLPGDTPLIQPATLAALLKPPCPLLRIPRYAGRRGHPVFFSAGLIAEFLSLPADRAARDIVNRHAAHVEYIDLEDAAVVEDVDEPEDYRRLTEEARP